MRFKKYSTNNPILILTLLLTIFSCKKETNYLFRIGINNLTGTQILVKVYPKSQFTRGDLYKISSYDDFSEMKFNVQPNTIETLYEITNLDCELQNLLTKIFDSLTISVMHERELIINFKPNFVENYKINMFSNSSIWTYDIHTGKEKTNFSSYPFEIHNYIFRNT